MQGQKRYLSDVPDSLYDAVSGVDKLVICDCDDPQENQGEVVGNVLRAWQVYRQDFAENQRAFNGKVQIFNFKRETDFELWDLERNYPSDMCYGIQRAGWTRNERGTALFVGQFFEAYGQCTLRSPVLKLNFSRFGGILIGVYNAAVKTGSLFTFARQISRKHAFSTNLISSARQAPGTMFVCPSMPSRRCGQMGYRCQTMSRWSFVEKMSYKWVSFIALMVRSESMKVSE
eukprot:Skav231118  [mRNA]  locus=scaffold7:49490:56109:- [translate_table: standard]